MDKEINDFKECIVALAELGFAPTISDLREIVADYVTANNHAKAKSIFNYKKVVGCPGPDWIASFIKEVKSQLKKCDEAFKSSSQRN